MSSPSMIDDAEWEMGAEDFIFNMTHGQYVSSPHLDQYEPFPVQASYAAEAGPSTQVQSTIELSTIQTVAPDQTQEPNTPEEPAKNEKRGRGYTGLPKGRPPGSKNKPKPLEPPPEKVPRPRGRPKGSKNKPKDSTPSPTQPADLPFGTAPPVVPPAARAPAQQLLTPPTGYAEAFDPSGDQLYAPPYHHLPTGSGSPADWPLYPANDGYTTASGPSNVQSNPYYSPLMSFESDFDFSRPPEMTPMSSYSPAPAAAPPANDIRPAKRVCHYPKRYNPLLDDEKIPSFFEQNGIGLDWLPTSMASKLNSRDQHGGNIVEQQPPSPLDPRLSTQQYDPAIVGNGASCTRTQKGKGREMLPTPMDSRRNSGNQDGREIVEKQLPSPVNPRLSSQQYDPAIVGKRGPWIQNQTRHEYALEMLRTSMASRRSYRYQDDGDVVDPDLPSMVDPVLFENDLGGRCYDGRRI